MKITASDISKFVHSVGGETYLNVSRMVGSEKPSDIIVYSALLKELCGKSNVDGEGFVYVDAFQKYLAEGTKLSKKTIIAALQNLENKGYISVEKVACTEKCFGPSNRYYILKEEAE